MDLFWILMIILNVGLMVIFYCLAQLFRRFLHKDTTVVTVANAQSRQLVKFHKNKLSINTQKLDIVVNMYILYKNVIFCRVHNPNIFLGL